MSNQSLGAEIRLNTSKTKLPMLRILISTTQEHKTWQNTTSKLHNHQEKKRGLGFLKE